MMEKAAIPRLKPVRDIAFFQSEPLPNFSTPDCDWVERSNSGGRFFYVRLDRVLDFW